MLGQRNDAARFHHPYRFRSGMANRDERATNEKGVSRIGVLWHAGSADQEEVYLSVLRK
jgi:hypothetical protein